LAIALAMGVLLGLALVTVAATSGTRRSPPTTVQVTTTTGKRVVSDSPSLKRRDPPQSERYVHWRALVAAHDRYDDWRALVAAHDRYLSWRKSVDAERARRAVRAVRAATSPGPTLYAEWSRVAVCESGGWRVLGAAYPDSLGITAGNWYANGGGADVTPAAQIVVARRLVAYLARLGLEPSASWVPDQSYCAPW